MVGAVNSTGLMVHAGLITAAQPGLVEKQALAFLAGLVVFGMTPWLPSLTPSQVVITCILHGTLCLRSTRKFIAAGQ